MGFLSSFFHPEKAYKKAGKEAQKGYDQSQNLFNQAQAYQQPFMQQGLDQYGRLNNAAGQLMNPEQLQSQWSQGYEQSPYAKQLLAMNQGNGLDAASQMGLMGSSAALNNIQQGAGGIVAQDRSNYMNDLMNKYMQGIGLGQNMYGIGAQTGSNMGNQAMAQGGNAMTHGQNMAGLKYGEQAAPGQLFGNILGGGLAMAANTFIPGSGSFIQNAFSPGSNQNSQR